MINSGRLGCCLTPGSIDIQLPLYILYTYHVHAFVIFIIIYIDSNGIVCGVESKIEVLLSMLALTDSIESPAPMENSGWYEKDTPLIGDCRRA